MSDRSLARHNLVEWARFVRSQSNILSLEPQLLLQQALNRPDLDPVGAAAAERFQNAGSPRPVIRWVNKPLRNDPVLLTLNTESASHCLFAPENSRLLTWGASSSRPGDARLWDAETGRLIGHWSNVRVADQPFVLLEAGSYGIPLLSDSALRLYDAGSGAELQTLAKTTDEVRAFAVSPGAHQVALGFEDGTVRLVHPETGAESFRPLDHDGPIQMCLFLLGGRRLVTRNKSKVRLFDLDSSTMLLELPDRDGWKYDHFEVSSDEQWMALEEKNTDVGRGWTTLWETGSGRRGLQVTGREHSIRLWGLAPAGDRVLALEFELGDVTRAVLELWGVASNVRELAFQLGWLSPYPPVRFSPDGRWLAAGRSQPTEPGDIELWDLLSRSETRVAHFQGHSSFVLDMTFSTDGRSLASLDSDGILRLWALPIGREHDDGPGQPRHPNEVGACTFTPDGKVLFSSCSAVQALQHKSDDMGEAKLVTMNPAEIRLWDAETGALLQTVDAGQQRPSGFSFSPDSRHLAVSSSTFTRGAAQIWDRSRMILETELSDNTSSAGDCRYTRDGRRVVSMRSSPFRTRPEDNALKIWDASTTVEVATLIGHGGILGGFDLSPNGRFAVASSELVASAVNATGIIADTKGDFFDALSGPTVPADLFLWDLEKQTRYAGLERCTRPFFSPDGLAVIALSKDDRAIIWQFASSTIPSTKPVMNGVRAARFSPDGRELALGREDGSLAMVDPRTGIERVRIRRSGETVHLGHFSSDGRYMLEQRSMRICVWDLSSGEQVAVFPASADLKHIAIGSDVTRFAAADKLGAVNLLKMSGIQPGPPIVTAVRVWRYAGHGIWRKRFRFFGTGQKDTKPTTLCPRCETEFVPDQPVLDAIEKIAIDYELKPGDAPSVTIPRAAWDEARLLSACKSCGARLRFAPFIA